jgi:hypothetical protein
MLGITNHSKVPLRVATMAGLFMSAMSLCVAFFYLIAKLIFWDWLTVGTAPLLISLFFFSSVQLFFLGMLGEYIGAIHTQVQKRPLVIESERVNFEFDSAAGGGNFVRNGSTADRGVVPARMENVPGVLVS